MKKSTVVLAIAAICMLAVIGCKNAAETPPVTPPVTPPDSNPTTMLSARFTDSTADKTYDFSLEEPAANSTVVSGKLYSQALAKTFSLKGLVNTVSGDFTLSMRSSTEGIRADVTGNTKKTDGTGLTLEVSMKGADDTWPDATSINLDTTSVKTGTAAVEVTGTVDPAAQDVGLPDEMLGTWKMYPTYYKVREQSDPDDEYPYEALSLPSFMFAGVIADSKISEPYYAVKGHGSWSLYKKETVDGKTTLWYTKAIDITDEEMKKENWEEYAQTLDYYSKTEADFVTTQTSTIYPFEAKFDISEITTLTAKVTEADLKEDFNSDTFMLMPFLEIKKENDSFDVIINSGDRPPKFSKSKYSFANNVLKLRTYVADPETGYQTVDTIEEARELRILTDEGFAGIFTR